MNALLLALFLSATPAADCGPANDDAICLEPRARLLLEQGSPREAVVLLKSSPEQLRDSRPLALLLAKAYLAEGNDFWALRVLSTYEREHAHDCEAALWMAWVSLRKRAVDPAREALVGAQCPEAGPLRARRELLAALAEANAGTPAAGREPLERALAQPELFPEDLELAAHLQPLTDPGYRAPVSGRLEAQAGFSSNALAGSPTDPGAEREVASPAAQLDGALTFALPQLGPVRPSVEGELRTLGWAAADARDLSYAQLSARPAFAFWSGRAELAGRIEALLVAGGDRYDEGPLWFSNGLRAEAQVELPAKLLLFAGGGSRAFRELGRDRIELDGGLGGNWRLGERLGLMTALTARRHAASNAAYDLWGGSLLVSLNAKLPAGFNARAGALAGHDRYPESEGYFDPFQARRETQLKLSASLWTPQREGLRAGLTYEHARRWSTADAYDFVDHRALLKASWAFSFDPWSPAAREEAGHVAIDYELGESGALEESVQQLLRQDEAMQRGSSCVER